MATSNNDNLPAQAAEQIGRFARFIQFQPQLWRFGVKRLTQNNLLSMSAALSFQTIFALIPTIVLAFLGARALGVMEDGKHSLRVFLNTSGFNLISIPTDEPPAAAELSSPPAGDPAFETPVASGSKVINVADQIEAIVDRAESQLTFSRIGPIGAILFIWTALSLLNTAEDSLNRVFGAPRSRAMVRRILLYWSVMTLGPVALAAAAFLGQQLMKSSHELPILSGLTAILGWLSPGIVGILVLTAVYALLPNTSVKYKAAFGGAVVAVLLWFGARSGFAWYVERYVLKANLYGILGVLPLFFIWLNFSWIIFLFGAELAYAAQHWDRIGEPDADAPKILSPTDALSAMLVIARNFLSGDKPASVDQIAARTNLSPDLTRFLLLGLVDRGCLLRVTDGNAERFTLARPPHTIAVRDLVKLEAADVANPSLRTVAATNGSPLRDITARLSTSLGDTTLADLFKPPPTAPSTSS